MSVTGNFVDAQLAYDWGLVNHVVPHDELLPFCRQLAADCRTIDQTAVRRMLRTYEEGSLVTPRRGVGRRGPSLAGVAGRRLRSGRDRAQAEPRSSNAAAPRRS